MTVASEIPTLPLRWDEASERWHVPPQTGLLLWLAPFALMVSIAGLRLLAHPLWRELARDEGPMEILQFLCLLVAAGLGGLVALQLQRSARPLLAALYCGLALGLAFVAGEEIAWGQWLLGFDTPTELAEINYKAEASLHNVSSVVGLFNVAKLSIGAYGVFGAWLLWRWGGPRTRQALDLIVVPWFLCTPFLFVFVIRGLRFTVLDSSGYGEVEELYLAYGMLAFTAVAWRRVCSEQIPRSEGSAWVGSSRARSPS